MALKPAYTGICTFCRTPHLALTDNLKADVIVLGVPYDGGVGFRPGTRFGPRSIREYSLRFPYFGHNEDQKGYWDIASRQWRLTNLNLVDCGDIDIVPLDSLQIYNNIEKSVKKSLQIGAMPVILGGDHSITFPAVRAFANNGPLSLIHLDAHLDRRETTNKSFYGHGSPIKLISELDFIDKIITIGIRGLRAPEDDYLQAEERGELIIPRQDIRERGLVNVLSRLPKSNQVYISIDIDVLDPSVAPGTGTPETDGLCYYEVRSFLKAIAADNKVVGFDLVEVNPSLDLSGITSLTAAQLIVELLGDIFS